MNKYFKIFIVSFFILLISSSITFANESEIPNVGSPSALLMDLKTGKILYEKNINEKMYPASLTKIMTAILVLENCDLNDVATVSDFAVSSVPFGYVTADLQVGEELKVEQLLNVLLVGSCNDAATVLAEHVAGSVENFSIMMNKKAKELGCNNTNFVNPNGLHSENHYSTAYDLSLISKYAMKNETFRKIVSKLSYKLPTTNKYTKKDRVFYNANSLLFNGTQGSNNYYYKYATRN